MTFAKCVEMARTAELTKKHASDMQKQATHTTVDAVGVNTNQRSKPFGGNNNNNQRKNVDSGNGKIGNKIACKFCKSTHEYGKCPAFGKKCNNCSKLNHFSVACRAPKIREIFENSSDENDVEINLLSLASIPRKKNSLVRKGSLE